MRIQLLVPFFGAVGLLLTPVCSPSAVADEKQGILVLPDKGTHYAGPKGREADSTELLVSGAQSGGSVGLYRQVIAPKSGPPAHIHRTEDEFFYVVSGSFNFKLGDRSVSAPPGSVVFIPRGIVHTFENTGTEPGVLLEGVTPAGLEMFFAERQGADAETVNALNKKHDTEIVGPPLK